MPSISRTAGLPVSTLNVRSSATSKVIGFMLFLEIVKLTTWYHSRLDPVKPMGGKLVEEITERTRSSSCQKTSRSFVLPMFAPPRTLPVNSMIKRARRSPRVLTYARRVPSGDNATSSSDGSRPYAARGAEGLRAKANIAAKHSPAPSNTPETRIDFLKLTFRDDCTWLCTDQRQQGGVC